MNDFAATSANNPNTSDNQEQRNASISTNLNENNDNSVSKEENKKSKEDNHYGMLGLLDIFKSPNADILVKGNDLKFLGFDFNSDEKFYSTFGSPFSNSPMINTKTNFKLPECYKVQQKPFSALSKISRFSEEILFYMFYNMPQTYFQEAAAQELFNRKWRYHKKYSLWFSKEPGNDVVIKGDGYEKGVYIIYDPISLKQVKTECTLYYALLEDRSNSVLFNQYDINEQLDTKINAANYQAFLESQQQMSKVNSINSMASMNSSINNMEGLGAMNSMNNSLNNISKVNNMNNLNAENMMPGMNQINSQNQVMPSNFPMQNQTMNGMTIPPQLNGNMNSNWMMPMDPNTAAAINYGSQYVNMNNQMNPMNGLINNLNQPQNIPGFK
jgi:CCR4-NOT transcription complex subunit 2